MTDHPNDTQLLAALFQRAYPLEPQPSAAEYLHHFEFEIDRLGRLLRFLGLAEASHQSGLGWAPRRWLMRISAERAARPLDQRYPIVVSKEDREFVASICRVATGDVAEAGEMDATNFCCDVLAALGLLERGDGKDGVFEPDFAQARD